MAIGALIIGDEILSGKRQDRHLAHVIDDARARAGSRSPGRATRATTAAGSRRCCASRSRAATSSSASAASARRPTTTRGRRRPRRSACRSCAIPRPWPSSRRSSAPTAYPHRVLMAEFPAGSAIIPNPVNRVASFSIRDHHFFPGFPQMAWPMLDWVLATHYAALAAPPSDERAIVVLRRRREPAAAADERQRRAVPAAASSSACRRSCRTAGGGIELGVRGDPRAASTRRSRTSSPASRPRGFRWEPLIAGRQAAGTADDGVATAGHGMDDSGRWYDEVAGRRLASRARSRSPRRTSCSAPG